MTQFVHPANQDTIHWSCETGSSPPVLHLAGTLSFCCWFVILFLLFLHGFSCQESRGDNSLQSVRHLLQLLSLSGQEGAAIGAGITHQHMRFSI